MATDLADYSQAVTVLGGSVSITGTATVVISGTVPVSISGTPTVNIGTAPTINVSGSVAITGTPTVNINTGQSVGITGTVTVAISGTPAVTVSSGSVSITGTPNVNIASQTGNLNVVFPSAQAVTISSGTVTISGTVPVTISSGTVSITGTPNINIQSQSIQVGINHPWVACGSHVAAVGADNFTTSAVPADAQQMLVVVNSVAAQFQGFTVKGTTTGAYYVRSAAPGVVNSPLSFPINGQADSQYLVTWTSGPNGQTITFWEAALPPGYPAVGQQSGTLSIPVVLDSDHPYSLSGQQTAPNSLPVVVASDQPPIAVQQWFKFIASYRAVAVFTCPANPTDIAFILGSSTKVLYVTYVRVGLIETTSALNNLFLIKRSTTDTGASNVAVATALDSSDPASTAGDVIHGINYFLANPTVLGTAVGSGIGGIRIFAPAAALTSYSESQAWEFGIRGAKPVVLRGNAEGLYVNLAGSGNAGLAVVLEFEWYEV